MWKVNKIKAVNFFSFEELEYDIQQDVPLMIYGRNLDSKNAVSNGSGKSAFLEVFFVGLIGETSRGVKHDEFIKDGFDNCEVSIELFNKYLNEKLKIVRNYTRKKQKITIYLNDEEVEDLVSVKEKNIFILNKLQIQKDDLKLFYLIGQNNFKSIFSSTDAELKKILSRIINIDKIEQNIEYLKDEKRKLENVLNGKVGKVDLLQQQIEELNENLKNIKFDIQQEIDAKTFEIQDKIEQLNDSLKYVNDKKEIVNIKQQQIEENEKKISELKREYSNSLEDITKVMNDLEDVNVTLNELNSFVNDIKGKKIKINNTIQKYRNYLKDEVVCPSCGYHFSLHTDLPLDEIKQKINVFEDERQKVEGLLKKQQNDENDLLVLKQQIQKELNSLKGKKNLLNDEIKSLENKNKQIQIEIEQIERSIERYSKYQQQIEELEFELKNVKKNVVGKYDKLKKDYLLNIKQKQKEKQQIQNEIDILKQQINNYEFWIVKLGKKGFVSFVVNKILKNIEGVTNDLLKRMDNDYFITIEGFKLLKNGNISEKISTYVIDNNGNKRNFKRFSGGEKSRISLSSVLGLKTIIDNLNPTGGLDLLILDEVFDDNLDEKGQIKLLKLLEKLKLTTFIVSHKQQSIGALNEIFIEKQNNVSKLKKNY